MSTVITNASDRAHRLLVDALPDEEMPRLSLAPLRARLDRIGIVEHSVGPRPEPMFGHCTDDAGRALGLATLLSSDRWSESISRACLRHLRAARRREGFALRLDAAGRVTTDPPSDDSQARALWGLAVARTGSPDLDVRSESARLLAAVREFASTHPRAAAHACLGALELLTADPDSDVGRQVLAANSPTLREFAAQPGHGSWLWPTPRLTYANALIVEAMAAVAAYRHDDNGVERALDLLAWLVATETSPAGWFSFTPTTGRGPSDRSGYDQQPIEAWAIAEACRRAYLLTEDEDWLVPIRRSVAWFLGANDQYIPVWNATTGAAHDGLTNDGVNANEGCESTMAWIATLWALRSAERHRLCRRSSR